MYLLIAFIFLYYVGVIVFLCFLAKSNDSSLYNSLSITRRDLRQRLLICLFLFSRSMSPLNHAAAGLTVIARFFSPEHGCQVLLLVQFRIYQLALVDQ